MTLPILVLVVKELLAGPSVSGGFTPFLVALWRRFSAYCGVFNGGVKIPPLDRPGRSHQLIFILAGPLTKG